MEDKTPTPYEAPEEQQTPAPGEELIFYPPKPFVAEKPANIWLKSILSLGLYLVLGYYFFPNFNKLLIITGIVIMHEMGHFLAMKYFRYSDLGIFFIPLLGAYVSGTKREVSQSQSAVILLAGPLPGIMLGIVMHLLAFDNPSLEFIGVSFGEIAWLLVLLNLLNLFPVYPLDGGQLLNRVFLDEESLLSKIFVYLSIAVMLWFAVTREFWPLIIFPLMMMLRMRTDSQYHSVEKRIEEAGINLDTTYDELTDEDYWKTRNILIAEHPGFRDLQPAPPFDYTAREEKVISTIQALLHRNLVQDMSVAGKLIVLLIWAAAVMSPWLVKMDMGFLDRFIGR